MAVRFAASKSEVVTAIGTFAGKVGLSVAGAPFVFSPAPSSPLSVQMTYGTLDPNFAGEIKADVQATSAQAGIDWWTKSLTCDATPATETQGALTVDTYSGCAGGSIVRLVTVEGMGHMWPEKAGSFDLDGSKLLLDFFADKRKLGNESDAGGVDSNLDAAVTDGGIEHDPAGYAIVGQNVYPPLVRRVAAVPCPDEPSATDECASDAECGSGFACACGGPQGFGLANLCVPAECRSDVDCDSGACLLSLGSKPGACCSYGNLGLFCERSSSTCRHGGDCPGNGIACMYFQPSDRFECRPYTCSCP